MVAMNGCVSTQMRTAKAIIDSVVKMRARVFLSKAHTPKALGSIHIFQPMTSLEKSRMSLVGRVGDEQFFFMIVFCKNFPTSKIIISLESHQKKVKR